jgi:hypothetical protein
MGRFDITPEVAEEYTKKYKDAAQPHVNGEVLAVGPFRRTGSGTRYAISKTQVGALAYGASSLLSKKKAGGLPGSFLLVVTPNQVHALDYKPRGRGFKVKGEVAVWDRSDLTANTERMQTTTRLTMESPAEDEKIVCDAEGMGDNPWADEVIRLLKDPSLKS